MSEDTLIEEIEEFESDDSSIATETLKEQLLQRCKSSGIETQENDTLLLEEKLLLIGIPNGREKRWIPCHKEAQIEQLLNIEFEKYVFIGD